VAALITAIVVSLVTEKPGDKVEELFDKAQQPVD
jgi:hypothetical protein